MKRTSQAILHRANRLNIKFDSNIWTEEEDNILRRYYPEYGENKCVKFLPNRTAKACLSRARILNLKRIPLWTEENDLILKKYYEIEGGEVYKRFNGKFTKHQCMQHARLLGLKATTNSADKWTEEDNDIIRKYYPSEGKNCYIRIPNATPQTVIGQASKLEVKYKGYKKVQCIETGEIFESANQADKKYKGANRLKEQISGSRNYAGKLPDGTPLHWRYIEDEKN